MINGVAQSLKDQRGAETLEWILVGASITAMSVTVYGSGILPAAMNAVVTAIETMLGVARGGAGS